VAAEVDGALALALHRQRKPSGRLRVSMPADFAQNIAVRVLTEFAIQYPEVQLELDLTPRRVDLIGEGFDLAIRMGELAEDSQLAARRLATTHWGLYASPDYLARMGEPLLPQALDQMHGLMLLSRTGEPVPWQLMRDGAEPVVVKPVQRTLANAPSLLAQMAEAGVGIAGIDRLLVTDALVAGRLQRVLPDWRLPGSTAWAVFPERRLMPLRTRVFLEAMSALLQGCPTPAA
jgi:DNA-binding transcriptional LysR family regulator